MMDAFGRMFLGWVPWSGDQERRRPNVSARIISVANNKGGTAKTTTAVNLASGLAFLKGYRVLLVDSDPQGNASIALDVDIENLDCSLQDLLTGKVTDFKYLLWDRGDNLKILPASNALQDIENELVSNIDGRVRLRERLKPILNDFDYVIIDTPPTLSIFTQGPLIASTDVIVCVEVGFFSLQGIRHLLVLQRGFTPVGAPVRCGVCDVRDTPHGFAAVDRPAFQAPTGCQTRAGAGLQ
jgi:cellulose biosynthesis protein BcsQ